MSSLAEVRIATVGDLEVLLQLERSCENVPHWSDDVWRSMLENLDGLKWHSVQIAETCGVVCGFVVTAGVSDVAELESVAVLPASRSQGLGRALCLAAMKYAALQNARTMELEVRSAGYMPRKLYASLGFVQQGIRRGYYRDPADDAVLMSVSLAALESQTQKV